MSDKERLLQLHGPTVEQLARARVSSSLRVDGGELLSPKTRATPCLRINDGGAARRGERERLSKKGERMTADPVWYLTRRESGAGGD